MYNNEGLCFFVEFALFDGFWPASHDVAHVIIWDVGCAQGKLGHNICVVCEPFSCSRRRSGGEGTVYCYNTHKPYTAHYYGGVHAKSKYIDSIIITGV